jgi:D-alanyl-D-alanine carboxypeptidase
MLKFKRHFVVLLTVLSVFCTVIDAAAARNYRPKQPAYNPKYSGFVVDGDTGQILYQDSADELRHPASLTKMMTLYLTFEALNNGYLRLDQEIPVSLEASRRPQTNLSLQPGSKITVREAIVAVVVRSANDVAVVLGEAIGGSEPKFAQIMTQRAHELGMKNTTFRNASGLHDPRQITTAKDMALLAIALKKHYPQYFHFFSRTEFDYNGVHYTGHNRVMEQYPGADGLKTGFVNASGFNLVTTASRRGYNLVGVVMGGRSAATRDQHMVQLLDDAFIKIAQLRGGYASDYPTGGRPKKQYEYNTQSGDPAPAPAAVAPTTVAAAPTPAPVKNPTQIVAQATQQPLVTTYNNSAIQRAATQVPPSGILQVKTQQRSAAMATGFVPYPKAKPAIR